MLRFLSRRRGRSVSGQTSSSTQIKNQRLPSSKNIVQCRVILLDGADLPIELSVSFGPSICVIALYLSLSADVWVLF